MGLTKHSNGVDEVAVFETGRRGTWVVKEFIGLGVGTGSEIDHEPTDEEIREVFGPDVNIVRGYALISTKAIEMIAQKIDEFYQHRREEKAMRRSPRIQLFLNEYAEEHGISEAVTIGSDHPYGCKCRTCLEWWMTVGSEEGEDGNPSWGPFTREEIENARQAGE